MQPCLSKGGLEKAQTGLFLFLVVFSFPKTIVEDMQDRQGGKVV
jgi:hypothetical protein